MDTLIKKSQATQHCEWRKFIVIKSDGKLFLVMPFGTPSKKYVLFEGDKSECESFIERRQYVQTSDGPKEDKCAG